MQKKFAFVVGDAGGAAMLVPVGQLLMKLGHGLEFLVDADGIAQQVLGKYELPKSIYTSGGFDLALSRAEDADVVVINTCATALNLGKAIYEGLDQGRLRPKIVFSADGLFNHGYKWLEDQPDYWLAINDAHARAIISLRLGLLPEKVLVVGQPAFDSSLELIPRKEKVREVTRLKLGIGVQDKAFLWYSQGMPEVIEEDVDMVLVAIQELADVAVTPVFMAKIHPKLDKLRAGYVAEIVSAIFAKCDAYGVRCLIAPAGSSDELNLASDVILSITATDDIRNWIMGGPPVIHMMGPKVCRWFENDLHLKGSGYLPDVISKEALSIKRNEFWYVTLRKALRLSEREYLRRNWVAPTEKATNKMVNVLLTLAG